jgi:cytochrome c
MTLGVLSGGVAVGLAFVAATMVYSQGDGAAGQVVFDQKCASCHSVAAELTHGLLGPNLVGVVGRTAGTVAGWDFSTPLKESKVVWTEENLNTWLTDSTAFVPMAQMDLKVPNRIEREDVISYLKNLKPNESPKAK